MSLTVTLHATGPAPGQEALEQWLIEQGEPFQRDGDLLVLRALPVRLGVGGGGNLSADLHVEVRTPIVRLVDLLFDLSVVAGADVLLGGVRVARPELWLRLADEQDRLRIGRALRLADERGIRDDVMRRLWAVLSVLQSRGDVRWSAELEAIVELREVGASGGLTMEQAAAYGDFGLGDCVPVPVNGALHLLAWRWIAEAYPSLAEA